jgi:hypothetical protein
LTAHATRSGKDPTKKYLKKKDGKGGWLRKVKDVPSVFRFFSPVQMPSGADLSDDDEDALEEVQLPALRWACTLSMTVSCSGCCTQI